ncbi:hypothetical protein J8F10_09070 [Gemmata sp. G18]|uniref:Uncharacterized protein n=1 Tax=Gemmata palustris TaxID=2822762 RepID=A0ABS5BNY7_9BACT|nr:hypothetical protein [Gemmata palustris]MBP3955431.1 hypothetical protein [Gemmata palustris]
MKVDLLALTREQYAKLHPERDTRAMPTDDTFLALVAAIESVLAPLGDQRVLLPGEMHRFNRHSPKDSK